MESSLLYQTISQLEIEIPEFKGNVDVEMTTTSNPITILFVIGDTPTPFVKQLPLTFKILKAMMATVGVTASNVKIDKKRHEMSFYALQGETSYRVTVASKKEAWDGLYPA